MKVQGFFFCKLELKYVLIAFDNMISSREKCNEEMCKLGLKTIG